MDTQGSHEPSAPAEAAAKAPRRRPIVAFVVLVAIIGGLVLLVLSRSSPEQQVSRLMDRQLKLALSEQWLQLYRTLSPKAKSACLRDDFVGELQRLSSTDPEFWQLIRYQDVHIQVNGDRAIVTYAITYNGRVVERATAADPDLFVRAAETVLGRKPDLKAALESLDRQAKPGALQVITSKKEYEKERARLLKFGTQRPVLYQKGQWYDDLDGHIDCGP
jgi:hypothetical protein